MVVVGGPFVLFPLAVVLSVLLVYTDSDYPFVIFKLFFILLSKLCLVYFYDLTLVFCPHFTLLVHR